MKIVLPVMALLLMVIVTVIILRQRRKAELIVIAERALANPKINEFEAATLIGQAYEKNGVAMKDLLIQFIEKYPESLELMRIFLAQIHADSKQYDEATEHARIYLRCVRDAGKMEDLDNEVLIREGVSRGVLILTAAYTSVGARSYSKRVLEYAATLQLTPEMLAATQGELARLDTELKDKANAELDRKWEELYANGTNAKELGDHCVGKGCPKLARRTDLVVSNIRFGNDNVVRNISTELYKLVRDVELNEGDKGQFLY